MGKDIRNPSRVGKHALGEPLLISFSGLDGAGKSTQIEGLRTALQAAGLTSRRLTFWDDVVVGAKFREGFVHKVYKSERGIGAPGKPVNRRDKNMRGWHLNLFRHLLYLLDALNLRRVIAREKKAPRTAATQNGHAGKAVNRGGYGCTVTRSSNTIDVIVLDRYIYDELANLNLDNPVSRAFARLLGILAPQPDVAYLLDAVPADARARKPEYSVEFMTRCRESYLKLAKLLGAITVVPPVSLTEAKLAVLKTVERSLSESGRKVDLVSGSVTAA